MEEVPRRTSLAPLASHCFVLCLTRVETEVFLDYQGRAGIISIVRCNLRQVIFGFDKTLLLKHSYLRQGRNRDIHKISVHKFLVANPQPCRDGSNEGNSLEEPQSPLLSPAPPPSLGVFPSFPSKATCMQTYGMANHRFSNTRSKPPCSPPPGGWDLDSSNPNFVEISISPEACEFACPGEGRCGGAKSNKITEKSILASPGKQGKNRPKIRKNDRKTGPEAICPIFGRFFHLIIIFAVLVRQRSIFSAIFLPCTQTRNLKKHIPRPGRGGGNSRDRVGIPASFP